MYLRRKGRMRRRNIGDVSGDFCIPDKHSCHQDRGVKAAGSCVDISFN
jgi:hypothetical protein